MAFCPNCGAASEGKYCPKCGTAVPSAPATSGLPPTPGPGLNPGLAANVAAALCYIPVFIPAILFLVLAPYNRDKTIRFHAWQSLFLQIAWVLVATVASIVLSMVSWGLWFALSRILNLAVILLAVYMMWKTYEKQEVVLPVVGDLAKKQA